MIIMIIITITLIIIIIIIIIVIVIVIVIINKHHIVPWARQRGMADSGASIRGQRDSARTHGGVWRGGVASRGTARVAASAA